MSKDFLRTWVEEKERRVKRYVERRQKLEEVAKKKTRHFSITSTRRQKTSKIQDINSEGLPRGENEGLRRKIVARRTQYYTVTSNCMSATLPTLIKGESDKKTEDEFIKEEDSDLKEKKGFEL